MLVSTKGRYALRVMVDLAENGVGPDGAARRIPLADVAVRQGISEKYLEGILSTLVKQRLLSGLRGKGGGYRLTRAPQDYSVADVLRLTEDTISPIACLAEGAAPCERAASCRTLPMWQGLDRLIAGYLDSMTIADLCRPDGGAGSPEDGLACLEAAAALASCAAEAGPCRTRMP